MNTCMDKLSRDGEQNQLLLKIDKVFGDLLSTWNRIGGDKDQAAVEAESRTNEIALIETAAHIIAGKQLRRE
jgi:hypothetical protein